MNFKLYDILSQLIPGFILYATYLHVDHQSFDSSFIVPATAISFVVGYFVNTLASWLEPFYYFTWGGKPSNQILEGKNIWKVKFHELDKTRKYLVEEFDEVEATNDQLFSLAIRYATPEVSVRVADFNSNYVFSRVILTTMLIVSGLLIWANYSNPSIYLVTIPIIFMAWLRSKQRGFYFAKEVLKTYLTIKTK